MPGFNEINQIMRERMLQGEEGPQAKELDKLVSWLRDDFRPDVVQITNSMLLGLVRRPLLSLLGALLLLIGTLPELWAAST